MSPSCWDWNPVVSGSLTKQMAFGRYLELTNWNSSQQQRKSRKPASGDTTLCSLRGSPQPLAPDTLQVSPRLPPTSGNPKRTARDQSQGESQGQSRPRHSQGKSQGQSRPRHSQGESCPSIALSSGSLYLTSEKCKSRPINSALPAMLRHF